MNVISLSAIILLVTVLADVVHCGTNTIFCYFGSWTGGRPGNGRYSVGDINPNLCTHISYSFIGLNSDGTVALLDSGSLFPSFVNLKSINPNVKLLISMGGWNQGSTVYSNVVGNAASRKTMVQSIYNFVTQNKFDGFDIDWEYPGLRGGSTVDKANYIAFLQELRTQFMGTPLLITAAVGATQSYQDTSYDVKNMNLYLDYINIMSYDLHGSYDGVTGQNSPLYGSSVDTNSQLSQDACVKAWINAGASPQKLLMGVGFYGRSFTLANPSNTQIGAPTIGPGTAGPYSMEAGLLTYLEICEQLKTGTWTTVWDSQQVNPYSFSNDQWVGYDNVESLRIKSQYAKDMQLGGIMIWSIDSEDHANVCGQGPYPLLNAINAVLNSSSVMPSQPPTAMTTLQPVISTTSAPSMITSPSNPIVTPVGNVCQKSGYLRDMYNCNIYYQCVENGRNGYIQYKFTCPAGLAFDLNGNYCQYPYLVPGCNEV